MCIRDRSTAPVEAAAPVVAEPAAPADDLTKIEGIGPKIGEALNNAGVTSFARMAGMTSQDIKDILTNSDGTFGNHDSTTWPQQAAMAAEGKWDELKAWQDELDGGKVVGASTPAAAAVEPAGEAEVAPSAPPAPVEPDDLTKIEGVGPKVCEILIAAGIPTFQALSQASPDSIKATLAAAGGVYANMDPTTWPKQAEMAAAGEWDRLQVWQDELDGGKM